VYYERFLENREQRGGRYIENYLEEGLVGDPKLLDALVDQLLEASYQVPLVHYNGPAGGVTQLNSGSVLVSKADAAAQAPAAPAKRGRGRPAKQASSQAPVPGREAGDDGGAADGPAAAADPQRQQPRKGTVLVAPDLSSREHLQPLWDWMQCARAPGARAEQLESCASQPAAGAQGCGQLAAGPPLEQSTARRSASSPATHTHTLPARAARSPAPVPPSPPAAAQPPGHCGAALRLLEHRQQAPRWAPGHALLGPRCWPGSSSRGWPQGDHSAAYLRRRRPPSSAGRWAALAAPLLLLLLLLLLGQRLLPRRSAARAARLPAPAPPPRPAAAGSPGGPGARRRRPCRRLNPPLLPPPQVASTPGLCATSCAGCWASTAPCKASTHTAPRRPGTRCRQRCWRSMARRLAGRCKPACTGGGGAGGGA
jgi:hypothetical protein